MRYLLLVVILAGSGLTQAVARQVVIRTSEGREIAARLSSVSDEGVEFTVDSQTRQLPLDDVSAIRRRGAQVADELAICEIALVDGSILRGSQVTAADNQVSVTLSWGDEVVVPRQEIRFIKLVTYADQLTRARWQELLAAPERGGDWLVFRRENQLDYLEGLVGDIDESAIEFGRQGQVNQAPRQRIDAVIYFHAIERTFGQPAGKLRTVSGDVIALKSATAQSDRLQLVTPAGAELSMPLGQLLSIELGNRRLVYLSSLEPTTVDWQPLVLNREIVAHQKILNRARFDQSFDGQILQLRFPRDEVTNTPARLAEYSRGIAAKGGTRLVFDLSGQYSQLTGIAGFAPGDSANGSVELVIAADGRELLRQPLEKRNGDPVPIQLNVAEARRLQIRIDYRDGRNIGDVIHLCDLKVSR